MTDLVSPAPASALALIAKEAALAVSDYLAGVARTVARVETKVDFHDPVTAHDRLVETALRAILGRAVPGSRVLGEEKGAAVLDAESLPVLPDGVASPDSAQWREAVGVVAEFGARVRWIVDPIDGTANFASGLPWFNTSIGVELDGEIVAGVVRAPLLGETFWADDAVARYEGPNGERILDADGPTAAERAVIVSYYPGPRAIAREPELAAAREARIAAAFQSTRRLGAAALDLAYVAAGWLGAMSGTAFKPWDVAAGLHILRIAGGGALNVDLATELPWGLRPGVVAHGRNFDAPTARAVMREIAATWES